MKSLRFVLTLFYLLNSKDVDIKRPFPFAEAWVWSVSWFPRCGSGSVGQFDLRFFLGSTEWIYLHLHGCSPGNCLQRLLELLCVLACSKKIRFGRLTKSAPSQTLMVSWTFFKHDLVRWKRSIADLQLRWRDQMLLLKAIWQHWHLALIWSIWQIRLKHLETILGGFFAVPSLTGWLFSDINGDGSWLGWACTKSTKSWGQIMAFGCLATFKTIDSKRWKHRCLVWLAPMNQTNQGALAIGLGLSCRVEEKDLIHMSWW